MSPRDRSISLSSAGDAHFDSGALTAAKDCYSKALTITRRLASKDPTDLELQRDLGIDLSSLGLVYSAQGNTRRASTAFEKCHALRQTLAHEHPHNTQFQIDLASILISHADVELRRKDFARAANYCQNAIWIAETAAPKGDEQRILSRVYSQMGRIRLLQSNPGDALIHFNKSLAFTRSLSRAAPENLELRRDHAVAANKLGDVYCELGDYALAWKFYKQCLLITQTLAKTSLDAWAVQKDLTYSYRDLGDVCCLRKKFKAALHYYDRCLKINKRLSRQSPDHAIVKSELASTHRVIAHTYLDLDDLRNARKHYVSALRIFQSLGLANHRTDIANLKIYIAELP